ncbi:MAG: hypothetical protein JW941_06130 [Candidatus Coatesbacteria bacterium]|nr:hypothetical protein [Candidatus Coatesbacteria bacterium]
MARSSVFSLTLIPVVLLMYALSQAGQIQFPIPGEEKWRIISDVGVTRDPLSDRCCAFDSRNRLWVCDTGCDGDDSFILGRWDGESWVNIERDERVWSICPGPRNSILIGEEMNLGYYIDDEYREIEMGWPHSERQYTTCFDDDDWVLSYGQDDGIQRTDWRHGGGHWISAPSYGQISEIDAWRGISRWACVEGEFYYWNFDTSTTWSLLEPEQDPYCEIEQIQLCGARESWAVGEGHLFAQRQESFYSLVSQGYPEPNAPIVRLVVDRDICPWCALENGQLARWNRNTKEWTHYTCDFLTGTPQDVILDHFENIFVITDEMIVMMEVDWDGIEFEFLPVKETYRPSEIVGINTMARNTSWVGVMTDLYAAFWNKATGEWLFLPDLTNEPKPLLESFWAQYRAPIYMGAIDIGRAPAAPGEYVLIIGFMFEDRLDKLSSNISTFEIKVE